MKNTIPFLFAINKTNAVLSRRLSGHGLDFSDFTILYHLNAAPEGKLRRIDLADKLGLTASGITRMLLPLEKLHIVERDASDDDARARYASLTPAGKTLLQDATATIEMKTEDFFPETSEDELAKFIKLLDEINK